MKRIGASDLMVRFGQKGNEPMLSESASAAPSEDGEADPERGEDRSLCTVCCASTKARCGLTWLKIHRGGACFSRTVAPATEDYMPQTLQMFTCVTITILSAEHRLYLLAFLVDIALMIFEMVGGQSLNLLLVVINASCILGLLLCYEQISEIAKADRQIRVLQGHKKQVSSRHEELRGEWAKADQFHELWKYRTLPCLGILAMVQEAMLDVDEESPDAQSNRLALLEQANKSIETVEQNFGSVEGWLGEQPARDLWKSTVGKRLMDCEQRDYTEIRGLLDDLPQILTMIAEERNALALTDADADPRRASAATPSLLRVADRPAGGQP